MKKPGNNWLYIAALFAFAAACFLVNLGIQIGKML